MLASPTSSASNRRPIVFEELMASSGWVADVKIDGVRCLAHWSGAELALTNRVGTAINYRYPEIVAALTDVLTGVREELLLDGEIVAVDGRFESTLLRDQQENPRRIAALAATHPVMYVMFDAPEFATPWHERREKLDRITLQWGTAHPATLATTVTSMSPNFLAETREHGMEGVIAKQINSRYEFGKRSKQWLKFKNLYRVTCLVAGYTPGTGSRSDFGAMELALLDGDTPVSVGRVGTGFTEPEIAKLKAALDRGDLLVVEIEATNQTSGGVLRFPVYKGVRTDVLPTDCKIEQLQFLPTC